MKKITSIKPVKEESIKKPLNSKKELDISINLSATEEKILSCLSANAKTIEEIDAEINIDQVNLIEDIAIMKLEGKIRDMAGGRYIAVSRVAPAGHLRLTVEFKSLIILLISLYLALQAGNLGK